jgi:hypothetical protein
MVKTYGAELINIKTGMCGAEQSLKVVTEYLPKRLSTVSQFSFYEALYILTEVLKGFREVYRRYGPVYINDDMIAFTSHGKARCWCNTNFAMNHPRNDSIVPLSGRTDQACMVTDILNLVE